VDLPTPPLPLATAMMRLTPGTLFWLANGLAGAAAGRRRAGALRRGRDSRREDFSDALASILICCAASGLGEVNCIVTLTAPFAAEISLTSPNETMSRE
jgi:hypothetical protein